MVLKSVHKLQEVMPRAVSHPAGCLRASYSFSILIVIGRRAHTEIWKNVLGVSDPARNIHTQSFLRFESPSTLFIVFPRLHRRWHLKSSWGRILYSWRKICWSVPINDWGYPYYLHCLAFWWQFLGFEALRIGVVVRTRAGGILSEFLPCGFSVM